MIDENQIMTMSNELVIYQSNELSSQIEVRIENDTIWLMQNQIVKLCDSSKDNISEHIKHIFDTGEFNDVSTVRKFRTVRTEENRNVTRELDYYSLDVIMNKNIYNFTVGELIKILEQYPKDMPVVVSGYENGYENFYHPFVKKVKHLPENPYWDGEFQIDENGTEVLLLEREVRDD